jgi:hypothetical protein
LHPDTVWWIGVVLLYGIGDVVTTGAATRYPELEEGMVITRKLLGRNPSVVGLVLLKSLAIPLLYLGYSVLDGNPYRVIVPVAITALGAYAVLNNILAIRSVHTSNCN